LFLEAFYLFLIEEKVKLGQLYIVLNLIKYYAMKEYRGVDVYIHIVLTSALAGGEWSASLPGHFTPREITPGTHWTGGWVSPRTRLDDVEKRKFLNLPVLEIRSLIRPAGSQSLSLRYSNNANWG
jgi:hypothetical protein